MRGACVYGVWGCVLVYGESACACMRVWVEIDARYLQLIIIYGTAFSFRCVHFERKSSHEDAQEVDGRVPIELDTGKWRTK